jgi:cobyrinic acid a,c-diamide synthase
VRVPCLGGIERDEQISIPERHLGLVTSEDLPLSDDAVGRLSGRIADALDLDRLLVGIPQLRPEPLPPPPAPPPAGRRVRIGVARDRAFCFYYQDNFDRLTRCGAELVEFSPVDDPALPPGLSGMVLGGGYPELFADRLSANQSMLAQVRAASRAGMPIYAECGGLMYLGKAIVDQQGRTHRMTGCMPIETRMLLRRRSLGYRQVTFQQQNVLGGPGESARGHEYHYSEISNAAGPVDHAYRIADRDGGEETPEGYVVRNTLGSYVHLHFESHPPVAEHFVDCCRRYHEREKSKEKRQP